MSTKLLAAAAVGLLGGVAFADIIHVPGDQPTIQAAIDIALDGDQIVVAPGSYNGIDFLGKAITVYATGGPDVTIIDATGLNSSVVKCVNFEDLNTRLWNFTITGGDAEEGGQVRRGGGAQRQRNAQHFDATVAAIDHTHRERGGRDRGGRDDSVHGRIGLRLDLRHAVLRAQRCVFELLDLTRRELGCLGHV